MRTVVTGSMPRHRDRPAGSKEPALAPEPAAPAPSSRRERIARDRAALGAAEPTGRTPELHPPGEHLPALQPPAARPQATAGRDHLAGRTRLPRRRRAWALVAAGAVTLAVAAQPA